MAETIVFSVLQKLAEIVIEEAQFLREVNDKVEVVKHELKWIQCFLKDADSKRKFDNGVKNWIHEVRDVSYQIEDVLDTFLVEFQQDPPRKPGLINKLKRLGKKSKKVVLLHKLGDEIKKIEAQLAHISVNRERFGINYLEPISTEPINRFTKQVVVPDIETDIIGFDAEKAQITELLLNQIIFKRRVVSIVGQGGLGKTTLAQKIYNSTDVKSHFDSRIWLTISQELHPTQILKDAVREFRKIKDDEMERDEAYFIGEIHKLLKGRKYLVVLDDIWQDYLWCNLFQQAFPDVKNGSRVLITTRFLNVANMADPEGVCELRFLNNEESLQLFLKKAIPGEDCAKFSPPDLLELAGKFVRPCGGLPLALVVVGGFLSTKPANYGAWCKVLATMDWQSEGNKCTEIIATSYDDLPLKLKLCFIYLASFPEDYEFSAYQVIHLWVAEGFILDDKGKIMEDTAENYLEDLTQRCMIQVSWRYTIGGSIGKFRIHDVLRDLAIHEVQEHHLLKIFSKQNVFLSNDATRRATFILEDSDWDNSSFADKRLIEYTKPNLRTLIFFGKVVPFDSQFKLIRVLWIQNCHYHKNDNIHWWNTLKGLLHLRCLVFKHCAFDDFILPIIYLHNLQTLEIDSTHSIRVPVSLWGIKSLRHVLVSMSIIEGLGSLPHQTFNLPNLQSLVMHTEEPTIELLNMRSLRYLCLDYRCDAWESLVRLLVKLDSLTSLELEGNMSNYNIPLEIIDMRAFPMYLHLQNLSLNGAWQLKEAALHVDMFPPHLIKLMIENSHINQDPMPVLEKLPCLKVLTMNGTYDGKEMVCSRGGFSQLENLIIGRLYELHEWKVEKGAMPMLNCLAIYHCRQLEIVPDLHHVPTLNGLKLVGMGQEFNSRVQDEEQHKVKHVSSISIN